MKPILRHDSVTRISRMETVGEMSGADIRVINDLDLTSSLSTLVDNCRHLLIERIYALLRGHGSDDFGDQYRCVGTLRQNHIDERRESLWRFIVRVYRRLAVDVVGADVQEHYVRARLEDLLMAADVLRDLANRPPAVSLMMILGVVDTVGDRAGEVDFFAAYASVSLARHADFIDMYIARTRCFKHLSQGKPEAIAVRTLVAFRDRITNG